MILAQDQGSGTEIESSQLHHGLHWEQACSIAGQSDRAVCGFQWGAQRKLLDLLNQRDSDRTDEET
jgi:hypothetical protein